MPFVGGFGCLELVLYGVRVMAEQFIGSNLDMEWRRPILAYIGNTDWLPGIQ